MSVPSDPHASPRVAGSLTTAPLPRRVREALEALFGIVVDELAPQLERMLQRLDVELLREAESAAGFHEEAARHARYRVLHAHHNALAPRFFRLLENDLSQLRMPAVSHAETAYRPLHTVLRLQSEHEASEDSLLQGIARRHDARAALPLQLLGQRFGVLAGAAAFDASQLPVSPLRFGQQLVEACKQLEFELDLRIQVMQAFDQLLQTLYPALSEAMNGVLARHNVLPGLSFVPLRTRPSSAPRNVGGQVATAGTAVASAPQTAWMAAAPASEDTSFAMLQQLLAQRRTQGGKLRPIADSAGKPMLSTQDVVGLLDRVAPSGSSHQSMDELRQALLLRGRQQNGGEAAVLTPEDSDTFELMGMLYAEIARELRQGSGSTAGLLEKLQVPLLRVALKDHTFFQQANHPARQLLGAVADSGARWMSEDDADPQLVEQLKRAVDHVVEHVDEESAAFEAANRALQVQLQAVAKRAEISEKRHIEAMRGKEKLTLAKRRATEVIQQAIHTLEMPHFGRVLLTQAWADALTLTLLRNGADSDAWKQQMEMTAKIVASCHSGQPAEFGLKGKVEDALLTVGYHADDARKIAHRLTAGHEADETPEVQEELASRVASRGRLGEETDAPLMELPALSADEQRHLARLRNLPFGTWFDFVRNQQGDVVRRRMSWMSRITSHALFVNQRGQRVAEYSLEELARLMTRDQVRVVTIDEGHVIDRAWRGTLKALRGLIGADSADELQSLRKAIGTEDGEQAS